MAKIFNLSIKNSNNHNNAIILPKSIRACIIGKSGCGKTNLIVNLLLNKFCDDDYLDYNNLYIFSKSLHQPLYQILIRGLENNLTKDEILQCIMKNKFLVNKKINDKNSIQVQYCDESCEVPDPKNIDANSKTVIIFDDIMLEKQNKIEDYYTRGRHNNIDCFYISQNYIKLPKNTIRENANLFILFEQDDYNLNIFYKNHCADLKKKEFFDLCRDVWEKDFGFVTIDKTRKIDCGKYRQMLDDFYIRD
jgi:hypothetical protein